MSEQTPNPDPTATEQVRSVENPEEYGSLSVEDEGVETVDPAEVASTAGESDHDVGKPAYSEADRDEEAD